MKKEKRKGNYRRLSQDEFIANCIKNQKIDFDYSQVKYITQHEKVTVRCVKHDVEISVKAQDLMMGKLCCKTCLREQRSHALSIDKDEFLRRFYNKFPDSQFDFSKAEYTRASEHIIVTCGNGHEFSAKAGNLMSGYGCATCHHINMGFLFSYGKEGYIKKFQDVFGDRYDYSSIKEFKNCKEKVDVTCREHGVFKITPDNHSRGRGCPLCGKTGYQPQKSGYFYILKVTENVIKFGITNDLDRRVSEVNKKSTYGIELLHSFFFEDGYLPQKIEMEIYRDPTITRNVVSRADFKSGFTETTFICNLEKILNKVNNFFTNTTP